jgi:3-deoxy-D-manno-octulosonic-acid transferase
MPDGLKMTDEPFKRDLMLFFLYNFLWTLFFIIILPLLALSGNLRLPARLGLNLPANPSRKKRIWIHALSVGEVISAIPLVRAVKSKYPSVPVVFTVKTSQGMEVAGKELGNEVDVLAPMPVDFWWSISRIFHFICPSVLILVEGDIWPGLLSYLQKRDIKVLLVNGRISPRTLRAYRRFSFFVRPMLNRIELFLMQSAVDRERLIETGLPPEKVENTGNIKFDRAWRPMEAEERYHWVSLLRLRPEDTVWVAGSTHEGEHELILETHERLKKYFPGLFLIIAPRKIESAGDIYKISMGMGLDTVARSDLSVNKESPSHDVLILDTVGELERIYGLARISFVGGSMVPVGGHNLLEPASFGCPVLFGEYTHNFQLMSQNLTESGGGLRIKDRDDLFSKMKTLLSDRELSARMGKKAKEFVLKNSGSMDRVMAYLEGYINRND